MPTKKADTFVSTLWGTVQPELQFVRPTSLNKYNREPQQYPVAKFVLAIMLVVLAVLFAYWLTDGQKAESELQLNGQFDNDIEYYKANSFTAFEYILPDAGSEHYQEVMPTHYRILAYADKPIKLIVYQNDKVYKTVMLELNQPQELGVLEVLYGVHYTYQYIALQPNTRIAYLFRRT